MASTREETGTSSGDVNNENQWNVQSQSTGGNDNPWNMSPAVTITGTQSELSLPSMSTQPSIQSNREEEDVLEQPTTLHTNLSLAAAQQQQQQQEQQATHPLQTALSAPSQLQQQPLQLQPTQEPQSSVAFPHPHPQLHINTSLPPTASATMTPLPQPSGDVEEDSHYHEGGPLWQAALRVAEKEKARSPKSPKPRSRFAESIMERTRSRADPNAIVTPSSNAGKSSMVTLGDGNEGSYILSTALAKKRVRVVQLLLIGLVGLLLGLLGNFFVSTSCHFATVNIMVGQNDKYFEFHFGLWKYSPIESVFQGYPYCYKYDQNYSNEAPVVARVLNIAALVAGLLAISILWLYLIFGSTTKRRWKWAVRIAIVAGLLQLATLYFFLGSICREYACQFGSGAYLAVFTSVVWFVLACEMHYHMPVAIYASSDGLGGANISAMEEPGSLVTTMEMTHVDEVAREYITRVTGPLTKEDEMPRLGMDLRRVRPSSNLYSPKTSNGTEFIIPSPRGTYQAPDPSLLEEALVPPSSANKIT